MKVFVVLAVIPVIFACVDVNCPCGDPRKLLRFANTTVFAFNETSGSECAPDFICLDAYQGTLLMLNISQVVPNQLTLAPISDSKRRTGLVVDYTKTFGIECDDVDGVWKASRVPFDPIGNFETHGDDLNDMTVADTTSTADELNGKGRRYPIFEIFELSTN